MREWFTARAGKRVHVELAHGQSFNGVVTEVQAEYAVLKVQHDALVNVVFRAVALMTERKER